MHRAGRTLRSRNFDLPRPVCHLHFGGRLRGTLRRLRNGGHTNRTRKTGTSVAIAPAAPRSVTVGGTSSDDTSSGSGGRTGTHTGCVLRKHGTRRILGTHPSRGLVRGIRRRVTRGSSRASLLDGGDPRRWVSGGASRLNVGGT